MIAILLIVICAVAGVCAIVEHVRIKDDFCRYAARDKRIWEIKVYGGDKNEIRHELPQGGKSQKRSGSFRL